MRWHYAQGGRRTKHTARHETLHYVGSCYQCSLISGTSFESSKLPLPSWFLATHLMTQGKNSVSALELKRHLGVSYPTAWLLKRRLMITESSKPALVPRHACLLWRAEHRVPHLIRAVELHHPPGHNLAAIAEPRIRGFIREPDVGC